jgi:16S rRNA G527 N7-methylase RsmG
VSHHLLDSLAVLRELPMSAALVGCGLGRGPARDSARHRQPAARVTLNDANERRGAFLRQA